MKYLLTSIIILCSVVGHSQIVIPAQTIDVHPFDRTHTSSIDTVYFEKPQMDTIEVIVLYCDTETQDYVYWTTEGQKTIPDIDYAVKWKKGYSVRKETNVNKERTDGGWCVNCPNYFKHVEYLDQFKKPLKKSIIVWNYKEIKN